MATLAKARRKAARREQRNAAAVDVAAPAAPAVRRASALTAYGGADRANKQSVALWRSALASADADYLYERDTLVSRARDLTRNDGTAATAVQRTTELVVGNRWMLAAKPDGDALGLDRDATRAIGRQMEAAFRRWAEDPRKFCDRSRRLTFAGMLTLMARQWVGPEGEAVAILGFKQRPGAAFKTTLQVIDPDRLCNPAGKPSDQFLRGGIEFDEDGAPIAAHIRKRHPVDIGYGAGAYEWERVDWETPTGRPIVLHLMEHERAGQSRGVTRFAPILANFKQLAQLTESEIATALINAMMAAFVKSGADPAALAQAMTGGGDDGFFAAYQAFRAAYYAESPALMNGVVLPILAPGDEVELNTASRTATNFVAIRSAFTQTFSAQIGVSYELVSGDFSKTNYSSSRASDNHSWRGVLGRRSSISEIANLVFMAVAEEAFDQEMIELPAGAPAFEDMPEAYCRAKWIGPGRGYMDPVKERQASQLGLDIGLTTLEQECAEQGLDWEDILDQREFELRDLAARGITLGASQALMDIEGTSDAENFTPPPGLAP